MSNTETGGAGNRLPLICIAIPNRDDFKQEMISALFQIATLKRYDFNLFQIQTAFIDDSRNRCFEHARNIKADYLLFLDSDIGVEGSGDFLTPMIELNKDVVTGIYVQRAFPYRPVMYSFTEEGKAKNYAIMPASPTPVDAAGCGLMLISKKVIDAFTPEYMATNGQPFDFIRYGQPNQLREDLAFCWRLKEMRLELWADPRVKLSHNGKHKFMIDHFEAVRQSQPDAVPEGIQGWTTDEELAFLGEQAQGMTSIVELGSHKGRSADVLLKNCKGPVVCVDLWDGKTEFPGDNAERSEFFDPESVYAEFMQNVGHYPNVIVMRSDSVEAAKEIKDTDMVFIDADHSYEGCKKDIEAWRGKTRKLICGHDYNNTWPGVMRAVNEAFPDGVKVCGSIWYKEVAA